MDINDLLIKLLIATDPENRKLIEGFIKEVNTTLTQEFLEAPETEKTMKPLILGMMARAAVCRDETDAAVTLGAGMMLAYYKGVERGKREALEQAKGSENAPGTHQERLEL